jgi:hypothetical protein
MRPAYFSESIHETLLMVLGQIDELFSHWPPAYDDALCAHLAEEATKHLAPIELYLTLLAGPGQWDKFKVESCTIKALPKQLQSLLSKALARQLRQVLDQWVAWDIRQLRQRRKEAMKAAEAATIAAMPAPSPRVRRPPLTDKERADRVRPPFQPPGRT